ncbi:hypothetical protein JHK82_030614 [Glycine max]|nr:hypothetical protein JHK82_030614 [Glycine max]
MAEVGVSDNLKGLILAMGSSAFIGSSFILKKKGLKRAAARGTRAGVGGYTYLREPLWWAGMVTMITGEIANFVAYIYAPAVLVTPLGALSIIVSAVLSHFLLKERLRKLGVLGCVSCIVGSIVIVIHAPQEQTPSSVQEIWDLATQPVLALIIHFEPHYGQTNMLVYLGICSLVGSLTVVSIKAIGIAIKLTLDGISQIVYPQTWFFLTVAIICVITQLNYLNRGQTLLAFVIIVVFKRKTNQRVGLLVLTLTTHRDLSIAIKPDEVMVSYLFDAETFTWFIGEDLMKDVENEHLILIHDSDYLER